MNTWAHTLRVIPFVWLVVVALVLLTYKPARWLTLKIASPDDSFGATVTINILCSVLLLSVFLTVVGSWMGNMHIGMEPIKGFFYKWPRNFALSLGIELLVAQPIARLVMHKYHKIIDRKTQNI